MTKSPFIPNFLKFYNILWQAARPFLKGSPRLAPTFCQRINPTDLPPAEVWIQAASAGEAFLALSILRGMTPPQKLRILLTSTTDQGLEILEAGLADRPCHPNVSVFTHVFPFDMPAAVKTAVMQVSPKVMVLLETELWPALLYTLKQHHTKILILNARMSAKSFRHYRLTRKLWQALAPSLVLATSPRDARRFSRIFPITPSDAMSNIKFDTMQVKDAHNGPDMTGLFPRGIPVTILASIRRQEEADMVKMAVRLKQSQPDQVLAVFPRHMHRIKAVVTKLTRAGLPPVLRSCLPETPLAGPAVVVWDRFGELRRAYACASAVFVGGSLAPLGGQNFLEPAVLGVPTVIGPHWEDFAWVGRAIFDTGTITRCADWKTAADAMLSHLADPVDHLHLKKQIATYVQNRQGGSRAACRAILDRVYPSL